MKPSRKNQIDIDSFSCYKRKHLIRKRINKKKQNKNKNKLILKTMQKFKSERNNVFIKEINKTVLSLTAYKIMQSIDLIEICA